MPFGWLGRGRLGAVLGAVRNVRRTFSINCDDFRYIVTNFVTCVSGRYGLLSTCAYGWRYRPLHIHVVEEWQSVLPAWVQ